MNDKVINAHQLLPVMADVPDRSLKTTGQYPEFLKLSIDTLQERVELQTRVELHHPTELQWQSRNIRRRKIMLLDPIFLRRGWETPEGEKVGLVKNRNKGSNNFSPMFSDQVPSKVEEAPRARLVPPVPPAGGLSATTDDIISLLLQQCSFYVNLRLYLLSSRVRARAANVWQVLAHRLKKSIYMPNPHCDDSCRRALTETIRPILRSLVWEMAPLVESSHCQSCDRISPITLQVTCPECGIVKYCNRECLQEDRALHEEPCRSIYDDRPKYHNITHQYYTFNSNYGVTLARCTFCHYQQEVGAMKLCSKCRRSIYCGVVCQRAHWPKHRDHCFHH